MTTPKPTPPLVSGARPLAGHLLEFRSDRFQLFQRGYREHGALFAIQLGPQPVAVMIGPENQRIFFEQTDDRLLMSTPYRFLEAAFGEVLFIAPHETYLRQRPVVLQAFTRAKMSAYIAVMQERIQRWLDGLGNEGEMELTAEIDRLVQDVAGYALMGERFQEEVGEEFWALYEAISRSLDPALPPDWPLPKFIRRDRARARLREILRPLIAERRRHPERYDDFFQDFVEQPYADGAEVEDEVLMGLMLSLMFAGHETTAGQAAWTVIQLLQHPAYLALVEEEIAAHVPAGTEIDHRVLRRLRHIGWAVRETERLHPSADVLYRGVDEPLIVEPYLIPTGWWMQVAAEVAHRLPGIWTNPHQFDPLRFAPDRAEDKQHRFTLIGFGGGAHKCTGMNFANTEMTIISTLLLQQFELTLLTPDPGIERGQGANRPEPTRIRYRRRR